MARVAVDGDSCGGTIIASGRATINGSAIALVGDRITPHGPSGSIHRSARIVSGSNGISLLGGRLARDGDYATCGHTISASNRTDDSSASWAPQPPAATIEALAVTTDSLYVEWDQGERYEGHFGAIIQWKGPGEEYDESRQSDTGFGITRMMETMGGREFFAHTVTGLSFMVGELYAARVLATRRFAEPAAPSAELTATPPDPMNP